MVTDKYSHSYRLNRRTVDIEIKLIIDIGSSGTICWNIRGYCLWTRWDSLTFRETENKVGITASITSICGKAVQVIGAGWWRSITATNLIVVIDLHIVHILKLNQLNVYNALAIDKLKCTMEKNCYKRAYSNTIGKIWTTVLYYTSPC